MHLSIDATLSKDLVSRADYLSHAWTPHANRVLGLWTKQLAGYQHIKTNVGVYAPMVSIRTMYAISRRKGLERSRALRRPIAQQGHPYHHFGGRPVGTITRIMDNRCNEELLGQGGRARKTFSVFFSVLCEVHYQPN